jgi:signal transduction histidine kinase
MRWQLGLSARAFVTLFLGGLVVTVGGAWWSYVRTARLLADQAQTDVGRLAQLRLERECPYFAAAERELRHVAHLLARSPTGAPVPPWLQAQRDGIWREDATQRGSLPLVAFVTAGTPPPPGIAAAWEVVAATWEHYQDLFPALTIAVPRRWLVSCGAHAPELADAMLPADPVLLPAEQALLAQPGSDPRWSSPYHEPATGTWLTACLIPIALGADQGAVLFQVRLDDLIQRCSSDQPFGTTTLIYDANGRVIHAPGDEDGIRAAGGRRPRQAGDALEDRAWRAVSANTADQGVAPLADGGLVGFSRFQAAGLVVATVHPASLIHRSAAQAARDATILGIITTLVLALIARLALGRHVAAPLRDFVAAAEDLARGQRGASTALSPHRSDELGELARALIHMDHAVTAAERELKAANAGLECRVAERTAELEQLNRELEAFSYSVSHDLRAPLRRIISFAAILVETQTAALSTEGVRHLAIVQRQAQEMQGLIGDLLSLSQISRAPLHKRTVDFSAVASDVLTTLAQHEPQRHVQWTVEPGIVVQGDAGLLRIVCDNLLGNAWKFTAQRTPAEIRVSRVGDAIRISDNGPGFTVPPGAKLFAPFQRFHTREEFPGTGIGLATVLRIIARHGGSISHEAEFTSGAAFLIRLPVA